MDSVPKPKDLKVVIVEDNEPLADIYKTRLELIGYKCFIAYDGEAALNIIRKELPDLVLLDLMVPKIAGDEILRRMRGSDWGKKIRVFVISNLNEVDAPKGLRDLGIEGYVIKANLSNDQLDQLVDNILKPGDQTESTSLEEQTIIPHDDDNQSAQPQPIAQQGQHPQNPVPQPPETPEPSKPPTPPVVEPQAKPESTGTEQPPGQGQPPQPEETPDESGLPGETEVQSQKPKIHTEPPTELDQRSL